VLRTALKPRWLGLFALLVVIVVACVMLGMWQLGVARDQGLAEAVAQAADRPRADVTAVLEPHAEFPATASARRISATGRYAASGQVLVADRRLDGAAGYWVLSPFVVESSGATLPLVRGFVRSPAEAPEPPAGTVEVEGALAPGESPAQDAGGLPDGQLGSVDLSILVNVWPGDLYNAFAFVTAETSAAGPVEVSGGPDGLARVPPPTVETGLAWRNAAYAVQWWIFAAFAVWMWFKMVRDDARGGKEMTRDRSRLA
jgi:cytochrome oxidase assembly protein ShyY1